MLCSIIVYVFILCFFFFFKQKTAYEMRISDWSSDVCSSDLPAELVALRRGRDAENPGAGCQPGGSARSHRGAEREPRTGAAGLPATPCSAAPHRRLPLRPRRPASRPPARRTDRARPAVDPPAFPQRPRLSASGEGGTSDG